LFCVTDENVAVERNFDATLKPNHLNKLRFPTKQESTFIHYLKNRLISKTDY